MKNSYRKKLAAMGLSLVMTVGGGDARRRFDSTRCRIACGI